MQYDDFHIGERAEIIRIVDQFACKGIILSHSIKFAGAEKYSSQNREEYLYIDKKYPKL